MMNRILSFTFLLSVFFFASAVSAQTENGKKAEEIPKKNNSSKEIILDDILIEAIVEKPNVTILPTRRLKKLGEIDFINRSFAKELKSVPEKSFLFKEDFGHIDTENHIKAILKKQKDKN